VSPFFDYSVFLVVIIASLFSRQHVTDVTEDLTDRQVSHKSQPVCVGSVSEQLPRLYVQLIASVDAM